MSRDLPDLLRPGDALVFNDTKVIPARLHGRRERDGGDGRVAVEATLHQRLDGSRWKAFVQAGQAGEASATASASADRARPAISPPSMPRSRTRARTAR